MDKTLTQGSGTKGVLTSRLVIILTRLLLLPLVGLGEAGPVVVWCHLPYLAPGCERLPVDAQSSSPGKWSFGPATGSPVCGPRPRAGDMLHCVSSLRLGMPFLPPLPGV